MAIVHLLLELVSLDVDFFSVVARIHGQNPFTLENRSQLELFLTLQHCKSRGSESGLFSLQGVPGPVAWDWEELELCRLKYVLRSSGCFFRSGSNRLPFALEESQTKQVFRQINLELSIPFSPLFPVSFFPASPTSPFLLGIEPRTLCYTKELLPQPPGSQFHESHTTVDVGPLCYFSPTSVHTCTSAPVMIFVILLIIPRRQSHACKPSTWRWSLEDQQFKPQIQLDASLGYMKP